jgi:glycosyltransferase involved in cell wall biosynthesis
VDSGSTDATASIATDLGATVFVHPFESHANQWMWALTTLPLATEWVIAIDADQRLTPELAKEIRSMFDSEAPELPDDLNGIYLNRRYIFRGRWLRHGGLYPKYLLKMFRRQHVELDPHDLLDHHFYVRGQTRSLKHDLVELNHKEDEIVFWSSKHLRYADALAREEYLREFGHAKRPVKGSLFGNPDQFIIALKGFWNCLPRFLRPFLYFFYRYIIRFGWLDGKQGLIFHVFQALWFRLLVDTRFEELRHQGQQEEGQSGSPASLLSKSPAKRSLPR